MSQARIDNLEVTGIHEYKYPYYFKKKFPFLHKSEYALIIFTKSYVYKYTFANGKEELERIKRKYERKTKQIS